MVRIRSARPEDAHAFLALVQELADYEKLDGPTPEGRERLVSDTFGPTPRYSLWVGEDDAGRVAGYAAAVEMYSTFAARPVLYLEDLYVTPAARGSGLGRALLGEVAADALRRGCRRLTWVVLDWNAPARRFYESLGAKAQGEWVPYAIEDEALEQLARPAP